MTKLFKNSKSILSCVLALAVLAVSLFTGVAIHSHAAAADHGTIDLLEFGDYLTEAGSSSKYYDDVLADNGETGDSWENAIIIDSAEEFCYLAKVGGAATDGKYYKVADGITGFNMCNANLDIDGTLADTIETVKSSGKNHSGGDPGFQGYFDGNGVTVYGATVNSAGTYVGLFSCATGDVIIKNVHVNKAYFKATNVAGGIVGKYTGEGNYTNNTTLTIENCSVTDSYLESEQSNYARAVGGILGYVSCPASYTDTNDEDGDGSTSDIIYVNNKIIIKNCYVNLDEEYFITLNEGGSATGEQVCHGGVVGVAGTNQVSVSDCVVIGITPYATSISTDKNSVQHSGLASHFTNVYTTADVAVSGVYIGGTLPTQDFTGKVFALSDEQLKGAAAVANMNLDWSVWMADADGYPELANAHKNISLVDNDDGTHAATCACGFGGIGVDCSYVDGVCACGAELNCATRKTIYWDGSVATGIATGTGAKDDPYVIKTAAELAWLVQQKEGVSAGKYFEVDESIGAIVLQPQAKADAIKALGDSAAVKTYFESESGLVEWVEKSWEQTAFCGEFEGNGVTVYGLYSVSASNAGLFSTVDAGAAFHNIALKNSYLKSEATNYQVGGLAAATSGASYGQETIGVVWFDGCVVANNYMYNAATNTPGDRTGVIIGASTDIIYIDNCLVYGNDATYGDGFVVGVWSSGNNNLIVNDSLVAPEGVELVDDGAETPRYCNMVRNSVIFGSKPYDLSQGVGSRFNDPKCYVNVLTDADVASDTFADTGKTLGATEEQIKTVTLADLATAELGDAWINTDGYPVLRAYHDDVFTVDDNGDGTHSQSCSCGLALAAEDHIWENSTCIVCGATCDHDSGNAVVPVEKTPASCTSGNIVDAVCSICNKVLAENVAGPVNALGHDMVLVKGTDATCTEAGVKDYYDCSRCDHVSEDEAGEIAIENLDEWKVIPAKGHTLAKDENDVDVYIATEAGHQKVCGVCDKAYGDVEAHQGAAVADGANGHAITCTVAGCGYAAESAPHVFGDDSVCDTCTWECTAHTWVDDGEPVEVDFMEKTKDVCKKVAQKCEICGIAGEDRVIGHTAGEWEKPYFDRNQKPACAGDGSHTEIQTCTECMFELDTRTVTDAKTGHSFSEVEASDPNCVYDGNNAYKYCPNCNYKFALDAADDEAYENALTDDELYIPADPEAHVWVEFAAGEADCENDGYSAGHKLCSVCKAFVVDGVATDIVLDYDKFYEVEYDEEYNPTPIGIGAIADVYATELMDEMFEQWLADQGIVLPEEPAEDADWEEWDAYYAEYDAIMSEVDTAEFEEMWNPILEEIWNEAYHQYFLAEAEAAGLIEVEAALGHNIVKVDEVPATYEADGVKAHWACENCDKLFADEEGENEVTAEDLVIAKLVKEDEKPADKPADTDEDKTDGDSSDKSPATGESVASVAAVAALMGAAYVLIRKARKA